MRALISVAIGIAIIVIVGTAQAQTVTVEVDQAQTGPCKHEDKGGKFSLRCEHPTPTATPPPVGDIEGVPICADHNSTVWHTLAKFSGSTVTCTYGHEHHDNPTLANATFGAPGSWAGVNQEISYPWQTFNATTGALENNAKHEGYKWLVRRNLECKPTNGAPGCLSDFRVQIHTVAGATDAVVRFHSFSVEARACVGLQCGIIRQGGWHDFGNLQVQDPTSPTGSTCPNLGASGSDPSTPCGDSPRRFHFSDHEQHANSRSAVWYTTGRNWTNVSVDFESFGPIRPSDPSVQLFYPRDWLGNVIWNGSKMNMNEFHLELRRSEAEMQAIDPDGDGIGNFNGYVNRYGQLVSNCATVGLDCVPLQIAGLPVGTFYQYRDDVQGLHNHVEYDTSPAQQHPTEPGYPEVLVFPN
jgi:hypothetical protein